MRWMDTMGRGWKSREKNVGARVVEQGGLYRIERSGWTRDDERVFRLGLSAVKKNVLSSHCRLLDSPRLRRHQGRIGLTLVLRQPKMR